MVSGRRLPPTWGTTFVVPNSFYRIFTSADVPWAKYEEVREREGAIAALKFLKSDASKLGLTLGELKLACDIYHRTNTIFPASDDPKVVFTVRAMIANELDSMLIEVLRSARAMLARAAGTFATTHGYEVRLESTIAGIDGLIQDVLACDRHGRVE